MSGEGANIAGLQSSRDHQESAEGKSGFGLGHSDSVATMTEGMKWFFTFHEGAIAAYSNVISSLVDSGVLVTLFGKSGNMFGIKLLEGLGEYLSEGGGGEMPQEGMHGEEGHHPDNYPYTNEGIAQNAGGLDNMHDSGDYHGQSFSPGPSPHIGDDHGHAIGD